MDTHTFIWNLNGDEELSQKARAAIEADNTINYVSIASLWGIAIKISLQKLELKTSFNQISRQIAENSFEILPVTFNDTLTVSTLPFHHRDPFDRILLAQSLNNELVLISRDKNFKPYQANVLW